jgi:hypothetical protein
MTRDLSFYGFGSRFAEPTARGRRPADTYEVEAIHRKAGAVKQTVRFDGKEALVLQLDLQVP